MPDLDALIKAKSAAAATLLKLPGVTGVGVGYREKGGQQTDEYTIRVYVEHKRPLNEVPVESRIPPEIGGFKTDVIEKGHDALIGLEGVHQRPIAGGLEITRGTLSGGAGSVCCFVNKRTKTAHGYEIGADVYMLTAAHVLDPAHLGGADGDAVYQPKWPDLCAAKADLNWDNDAGLARLGQGVTWKNEIYGVGPIDPQFLADSAVIGQTVRKQGRTTELTTGQVTDISYTSESKQLGRTFNDLLLIRPTSTGQFCEEGDSGGPVFIGGQDLKSNPPVLVGLVHAKAKDPLGFVGIAVKIQHVFNFDRPRDDPVVEADGPIHLLWAGRSGKQGEPNDVDKSVPMSLSYEGPTEIIATEPERVRDGDNILGKWTARGEGGGPYTFVVDPPLISNLTLSREGVFSGRTHFAGAEWKGNVTATDRAGIKSAPVEWKLTIIPYLELNTVSGHAPDAYDGIFYSFQLEAYGGTGPYTFSGYDFGNGVTLNREGLISGTPRHGSWGTGPGRSVRGTITTVGVTDFMGRTAQFELTITWRPPPR
jgi:hypothetical protein